MAILTNITITAYCACKLCCGSHATGLTADGHKPVQGVTVAVARSVAFGSHIHINGLTNDFIAMDRLARRFDNRIDIYFRSHKDALRFGKQTNNVTIYAK